ncbi:unnamed protein product [Arabidopsis thaliana]|uniref:Uncharacterized protein n=1 Tax=Arabidopsis thaliana TaxID=3702 RepID=A0A5S9SQ82_ARATH|nr:unnamed protein product [Arabidopsis thaliana]VYS45080.1 unnamed protein product [Arabidopsis thaliana]
MYQTINVSSPGQGGSSYGESGRKKGENKLENIIMQPTDQVTTFFDVVVTIARASCSGRGRDHL